MLIKLVALILIILSVLVGFRIFSNLRKPRQEEKTLEIDTEKCAVCETYTVGGNSECQQEDCPYK
ncbi:MAG: hypothetical protein VW226_03830 [Rhodospirillaceae bacterium]|jgi:hypothetical protein